MSLLIFYCKDLVIGQLFIDYFFLVELNELVASLDARWEAHSRVSRVQRPPMKTRREGQASTRPVLETPEWAVTNEL